MVMFQPRIVDSAGNVVKAFEIADIQAKGQIDEMSASGNVVVLKTATGANDPMLGLRLDAPLHLRKWRWTAIDMTMREVMLPVVLIMVMSMLITTTLHAVMPRIPGRAIDFRSCFNTIRSVASFFLPFAPLVVCVALVALYSVNVPFYDQWDPTVSLLFQKANDGSLSSFDLLAQLNEGRIFFPRLVFLLMGLVSGWNVRWEMALILFTMMGISLIIYRISLLTITEDRIRAVKLLFLVNLVLFSMGQYENLFWGIQLVAYIPLLCLVASLWVSLMRWSLGTKTLIAMLLTIVATFSFGNGMLLWVLVPVALFLLNPTESKKKMWLVALWILMSGANLWLYFYDWHKSFYPPSVKSDFFPSLFAFFGSIMGGTVGRFGEVNFQVSALIGFFLLALFAVCGLVILRHARDQATVRKGLVWLLLGSYSLVSGLVVTFGRLGLGKESLLVSRYVAFSMGIPIALIYLIPLCLSLVAGERHSLRSTFAIRGISTCLCLALIVMQLGILEKSIKIIQVNKLCRLSGKASLLLSNHIIDLDGLKFLAWGASTVICERARILNELHMMTPPLLPADAFVHAANETAGTAFAGAVDSFDAVAEGRYHVEGWAYLEAAGRAADAVVLTRRGPQDRPIPFAVTHPAFDIGPSIAVTWKLAKSSNVGSGRWSMELEMKDPPTEIQAWALDAESGMLLPLSNEPRG